MLRQWQTDNSRVRCDQAGLDALIANDPFDPFDPSGDRARILLEPMQNPTIQAVCIIAEPKNLAPHQIWIAPDSSTLLMRVDGEHADLITIRTEFLPAALARLVGLGPRHTPQQKTRSLDSATSRGLFHPDPAQRAAAFTATGAISAWALELAWPDRQETLTVLNSAQGFDHLFWEAGEAWLRPATATTLFQRLLTLIAEPVA
jgi:hypothetical protein